MNKKVDETEKVKVFHGKLNIFKIISIIAFFIVASLASAVTQHNIIGTVFLSNGTHAPGGTNISANDNRSGDLTANDG